MGQVLTIFEHLGADSSIVWQFGIFFLTFALLKPLLFNKLLYVIQLREEKTTKLEEVANRKFNDANRLAEEYQVKISKVHQEASDLVRNKKEEIVQQFKTKQRFFENENNGKIDLEVEKFAQGLKTKKVEMKSQVEDLANDVIKVLS